jgi:sec-independent protein translocase protein TatA
MGGLSVWHWLIFLAVALLLFGGSGKISSIMGDVAKGIKSFKKGMSEDDETAKKEEPARKDEPAKVIENATAGKPLEQHTGAEPSKTGWSPKA